MAFTKLGSSDRRPPGLQALFEHRPRLVLRRLRRGFHAAPRFQKLQDGPHLASGTQMAKGWSQPSPRKKDGKMWSSSPWKREDPGISQGSLYFFSKKKNVGLKRIGWGLSSWDLRWWGLGQVAGCNTLSNRTAVRLSPGLNGHRLAACAFHRMSVAACQSLHLAFTASLCWAPEAMVQVGGPKTGNSCLRNRPCRLMA